MAFNEIKRLFTRPLQVAKAVATLLAGTITSVVTFFAASADTTDEDPDDMSSTFKGGVLNYRTGKLDDGTDPVGWYKID